MAAADPQVRIEKLERALHWANLTIQKKDVEGGMDQRSSWARGKGFYKPMDTRLTTKWADRV